MAIDPATQEHLERAERNRVVARYLGDPAQTAGLHPPPLEWAVVVAFYAAVHYVNALLWQQLQLTPTDHTIRRQSVGRLAALRRVLPEYTTLTDLAYHARYDRSFNESASLLHDAIYRHLERVRTAVYQGLGLPFP